MGHRCLRGSCGLSIRREHELLVLWHPRCPEQDLTILKNCISMGLCRHVGHILEYHLLVSRSLLSGDLTWSRKSLAIFASHAGVYDLSLLTPSCHGDLTSHARCHGVGQHEGWLGLLPRLATHLQLATAGDGIAGLAGGCFATSRRL